MNNEPAFPTVAYKEAAYGGAHVMTINGGMTLRDYFAAKVMQAEMEGGVHKDDFPTVARHAYLMADAMLAAREVK